jgi:hypothetical protein
MIQAKGSYLIQLSYRSRFIFWWKRIQRRFYCLIHYGKIRYLEGYMDGYDAAQAEHGL